MMNGRTNTTSIFTCFLVSLSFLIGCAKSPKTQTSVGMQPMIQALSSLDSKQAILFGVNVDTRESFIVDVAGTDTYSRELANGRWRFTAYAWEQGLDSSMVCASSKIVELQGAEANVELLIGSSICNSPFINDRSKIPQRGTRSLSADFDSSLPFPFRLKFCEEQDPALQGDFADCLAPFEYLEPLSPSSGDTNSTVESESTLGYVKITIPTYEQRFGLAEPITGVLPGPSVCLPIRIVGDLFGSGFVGVNRRLALPVGSAGRTLSPPLIVRKAFDPDCLDFADEEIVFPNGMSDIQAADERLFAFLSGDTHVVHAFEPREESFAEEGPTTMMPQTSYPYSAVSFYETFDLEKIYNRSGTFSIVDCNVEDCSALFSSAVNINGPSSVGMVSGKFLLIKQGTTENFTVEFNFADKDSIAIDFIKASQTELASYYQDRNYTERVILLDPSLVGRYGANPLYLYDTTNSRGILGLLPFSESSFEFYGPNFTSNLGSVLSFTNCEFSQDTTNGFSKFTFSDSTNACRDSFIMQITRPAPLGSDVEIPFIQLKFQQVPDATLPTDSLQGV